MRDVIFLDANIVFSAAYREGLAVHFFGQGTSPVPILLRFAHF